MKLHKAKILNFKTIRNIEVDIFEDITLIVGKNNIGKSNVLKAIDLFFKNITNDNNVIVEDEDFRFNTSKIKISLTFNQINSYLNNLKEQIIKEKEKKRVNHQNLKEVELSIQLLELLKTKNDEITIQLSIFRNPYKKEFQIVNRVSSLSIQNYNKKTLIRKIFEENFNSQLKKLIDENNEWYKYSNINLKENFLYFEENKIELKAEQLDSLKKENIEHVVPIFLSIIRETQKFLYIPAYRGGEKERENTINKLFDIIIEDLVEGKGVTKEYDIISNAIWGTGRKQAKEFLDLVVKDRVDKLKLTLQNESVSNITNITFKPLSKKEIRKRVLRVLLGTSNIILDDGVSTSFESKGTGIQSSFMISIMKALSKMEFDSSINIILVIEEPEAFAHPQLTREIIDKIMETNKDDKYQFILTTHSPVIVNFIDSKNIQRLYESNLGKKSVKDTKNAVKDSNIKLLENDWNLINRIADLNLSEIVFADFVVFVEGEGDKAVFQLILKNLIPTIYHRISIISIGGCEQIFKIRKLLEYLNLNWIMVVDKDAFIKKKLNEKKVSLENLGEIFEEFQIGKEFQEHWNKVLKHSNVDKIILKTATNSNIAYGNILNKLHEIKPITDEEKGEVFKLISKKVNETFISDEEALEIINDFNVKLYEKQLPFYSLPADLETLVINNFTKDIVLEIYSKYHIDSYRDFVKRTNSYSDDNLISALRKSFGSKEFQLKKPSNTSKERKKPHIPIEIINNYLLDLNEIGEKKKEKILSNFPNFDLLIKFIEKTIANL